MKIIWAAAALVLFLSTTAARADDLQKSFDAVSALLQKEGGGVVRLHAACPKKNADPWEFVGSSTVVFVNAVDHAVLIDTGQCNGGNKHGQYLVITQNGAARVVTNVGIDDMSFLAQNIYADGDALFLYGSRWLSNDPHCCPSKKARLEYNIRTHQHKLTIVGDNKP